MLALKKAVGSCLKQFYESSPERPYNLNLPEFAFSFNYMYSLILGVAVSTLVDKQYE